MLGPDHRRRKDVLDNGGKRDKLGQDTLTVIQTRVHNALDQTQNEVENVTEMGCILKSQSTGFPNGFKVGFEWNGEVKEE